MSRTAQTLDSFATEADSKTGLTIDALEAGTMLMVKTLRSSYRLVVIDGPERLVRVQGGVFPEPTTTRLCGATAGGSAVKIGRILVGLRMEFCLGGRRITTSTVNSVTIEPVELESALDRVA